MQTELTIRAARPGDADDIGAVHVATWRSAYASLLSHVTLSAMSISYQSSYYDAMIRRRGGVFVAVAGLDEQVVGFASVGRHRASSPGEGEIYTLYVLDDWREAGIGRRLMHAGASRLADDGCRSAFLWVLSENPSRWFYEHLGGRAVAVGTTHVGGRPVQQTAYLWNPIESLLAMTNPTLDTR
ncbi:GNAT family N-acetyltransferase [Lichenicoccus roseus]|uniref:GNAT family N-acetyltransferase n=1 Tax=Lichenicoccus roseus TaxID=2683649 RepID=A0A5R9J1C7_9PROT|nr:GNAT family N-acetyltransferase [Lichenicoccus roseus]TLU71434.1 GNAT family N-acetyltransferase [Lichenicoccus roseus]